MQYWCAIFFIYLALIIASYDDARTKAIVGIYSDRMPGKPYLYDFKTKEIKEAADSCPVEVIKFS